MQSVQTIRHENPTTQADPERARLAWIFLERLCRLRALNESWDWTRSSAERRLLEHAIYSTYRDCVSLGLEPLARALLGLPGDYAQGELAAAAVLE